MPQANEYERIGRLIYGVQRAVGGAEGLRAARADDRVPADLAAQAATLAGRIDAALARTVANPAALTDGEVELLVADATELGKLLRRE